MDAEQARLLDVFLQTPEAAAVDELRTLLDRLGPRTASNFAWSIGEVLPELTNDHLEHLAKVFTELENAASSPSDFCGGSTTAVPRLVNELMRRDPERADRLIDWALRVACNPYNPFGTYNASRLRARTAGEYRALERLRWEEIRATEADRSNAARQRADARSRQHAAREAAHRGSNDERLALIAELRQLDPTERMRRLGKEARFVIGALPADLADIGAAVGMSPAERQQLMGRLERAPRGPWQRLLAALKQATVADRPQ